ncbi:MAG TPA: exodeoxyribonuclease VII small subunit [Bacilli bacterium]|jgi:exodeoxyribonuclease VII small subunit|nr:exodeoxyribonuclease VII small subunit [Bacilli bacterium]HPZ24023.1 exodeoxyribonuclease VII small subunit [Bacilli bacterium]HQC83512.1 exodeoxyribonuclease VII small subunit [Bacilli bacterium]
MEKKEKKFEELMSELEVIVRDLENGNADLEDSIQKYSEAMKLVKQCNDKLNNATESVNKILKEDGTLEDYKVEE